jgi:cell division protein FtsB
MRTVYITTADPIATVGSGKADAEAGSGLMLDQNGVTCGCDLFVETAPGMWVHAEQVPGDVLAEERRRGQLSHGIYYNGKLYSKLNMYNAWDKLVASKVGLELEAEMVRGSSTVFKAQVGGPMEELAKQVEALMQQLQQLKTLESEARTAEVEELKARAKKMEKEVDRLKEEEEEEQISLDEVKLHGLDFLDDITRGYTGKPALSTASLLTLAKAERISEYVELHGNSLLLDPQKMAALRTLLFQ